MKKILFLIALSSMAFLNVNAQNEEKKYLFNDLKITKVPKNTEKTSPWIQTKTGVRTDIKTNIKSDFIEFDFPKTTSMTENTAIVQRLILNIKHQIDLSPNVKAEIQVKSKGINKWVSFEPITQEFLDITGNGGIPSKNLTKYANGKIFRGRMAGGYDYDKIYSLHVAGTDAKLKKIDDVANIEKFRFQLTKVKQNNENDNSFWEIETLSAFNTIYNKQAKTPRGSGNLYKKTSSKTTLFASTENKPNLIKMVFSPLFQGICCDDGACPPPHGH